MMSRLHGGERFSKIDLSQAYAQFEMDAMNDACEVAFARVKRALSTSEVLVYYSLELPLVLMTDASATGIGAVISHITPGGERPIAYASRTLNSAERLIC